MLKIPLDQELVLETERVKLEPTRDIHAKEIIKLFQEVKLFEYIPREPRSDLEKLEVVYKKRQSKISPNKDEIWLNWIGREKTNNIIIGEFEATIYKDFHVDIAYMIDQPFQQKGYGFEVLQEIIKFLIESLNLTSIQAYIDTRNKASIKLVKKLGFIQIKYIKDADEFKGNKSDEYLFQLKR